MFFLWINVIEECFLLIVYWIVVWIRCFVFFFEIGLILILDVFGKWILLIFIVFFKKVRIFFVFGDFCVYLILV